MQQQQLIFWQREKKHEKALRLKELFFVLINCKAEAPHVCFKFSERKEECEEEKWRVNLAASLLIIITECP